MTDSNEVPWTSSVVDNSRFFLTPPWEKFFRKIQDMVNYLRYEESFTLVNNQASAADITPLTFDQRYAAYAVVDYFVQRVHSGTEACKSGRLTLFYLVNTTSWSLTDTADVSLNTPGVTFSITSSGQVQYTTSNIAGTISLSRVTFRVREMKAKSILYSRMG